MSNFNSRDGYITGRELARDAVIARTGCGIVTNQGAYPDPRGEGKAYHRQIAIYDDRFLPQFERIAAMIHESDAVALQQILHCGRYGGVDLDYCMQPSAVPQTLPHFQPPRELSRDDIRRMVREHAEAAERAVRVGFDGVEITSFMGYLLANFLSPFTNRRTDEYGGSVRNRARFMLELIEAIREAIGDRHALCVRLNGADLMDEYGGSTEDECLEAVRLAAESGGVDLISLCVGWQESRASSIGRDVPPGHWNYLAARAKAAIGTVPLAFGVRLPEAAMAEEAMDRGELDFWEVCRPFLADPERLHKYAEGREQEIKPCIGGLVCLSRVFRGLPYECAVNPLMGHEADPACRSEPAVAVRDVAVVGAGPAGLECALAAAERGHRVTVFERGDDLGGQLRLWARHDLAHRDDLGRLLAYYGARLRALGVPVELGVEVAADFPRRHPEVEVVVLATGAGVAPAPPGVDPRAVVGAYEVLEGRAAVGRRVVVVGGGQVGLCLAESLASAGRRVTLVEEGRRIGEDVAPTWKWRHGAWLEELGVEVRIRTRLRAVEGSRVLLAAEGGDAVTLEADTVVLSHRRPEQGLVDALEFAVDEVCFAGDAVRPRTLHQAIHEGYRLGVRI